ncbi:MAG: class I SAM-dependent methyltransferase [Shewanella sp.]|nr:class I SAM-dependent methyltransferase [Shewanella sp.]
MVSDSTDQAAVKAGQAVYTKSMLMIYDVWVLGISNSFIWKCSTKRIKALFDIHVSQNHLDVGVGTGYYLDKCLAGSHQRIGLLDLNHNSLNAASKRVARLKPEIFQANILEPLSLNCRKFESISMNYLLHCLPGKMASKSMAIKHVSEYLVEDGVLFGSTILGKNSEKNWFANKLMRFYNAKGVFDNLDDDLSSLQNELEKYFISVDIEVSGCVALFIGQGRKPLKH